MGVQTNQQVASSAGVAPVTQAVRRVAEGTATESPGKKVRTVRVIEVTDEVRQHYLQQVPLGTGTEIDSEPDIVRFLDYD